MERIIRRFGRTAEDGGESKMSGESNKVKQLGFQDGGGHL